MRAEVPRPCGVAVSYNVMCLCHCNKQILHHQRPACVTPSAFALQPALPLLIGSLQLLPPDHQTPFQARLWGAVLLPPVLNSPVKASALSAYCARLLVEPARLKMLRGAPSPWVNVLSPGLLLPRRTPSTYSVRLPEVGSAGKAAASSTTHCCGRGSIACAKPLGHRGP